METFKGDLVLICKHRGSGFRSTATPSHLRKRQAVCGSLCQLDLGEGKLGSMSRTLLLFGWLEAGM